MRTQKIDGEFWFSAKYAASLLATTAKKMEAMAVRNLVKSKQDGLTFLIAEEDVTFLRQNPKELKAAKEKSRMPAYPRRSAPMPSATSYVGEPSHTGRTNDAIGSPLKDPKPD